LHHTLFDIFLKCIFTLCKQNFVMHSKKLSLLKICFQLFLWMSFMLRCKVLQSQTWTHTHILFA
jgi:hypothetical protein